MRYFQVKNWREFQHYTDRNPPWIKLHTALIGDYQFTQLSERNQLDLVKIWVLAAQLDNRIPDDRKFVQQRIGSRKPPDLHALWQAGWLIDEPRTEQPADRESTLGNQPQAPPAASDLLAPCKQDASNVLALARSREERQRRGETEGEARAQGALPTQAHRDMAKRFNLDCDFEWAKYRDWLQTTGKRHKDQAAGFRNWLRKAHDYQTRNGRHQPSGDEQWGKVI